LIVYSHMKRLPHLNHHVENNPVVDTYRTSAEIGEHEPGVMIMSFQLRRSANRVRLDLHIGDRAGLSRFQMHVLFEV